MSNYNTPLGPVFELQREAIKRGTDILRVPRTARSELVEDGLTTSEQLQRQSLELGRQSIHQSISIAENVGEMPTGVHRTVDTLFETLLDQHRGTYETIEQAHERTDTEMLTRGAEQLTILLDVNRRIETQLVDAIEAFEQQAERSNEFAAEIERQLDTIGEQLETQTARYSDLSGERSRGTKIPVTTPASDDDEAESLGREPAEDGTVVCRVCGESYGAITHSHLQTHEMTIEEYRAEFGDDVPL